MENKPVQQKGALLLEIVVAVAAAAIVISLGAQMAYVSLYSNKISGERSTATGLAEEALEAVNAIATEKWQDILLLDKGSAKYHIATSTGKWVTAADQEVLVVDGKDYTRYFVIKNVCRDNTTKNITGITDTEGSTQTCSTYGGNYDPSTQKIETTVTWQGGETVVFSDFLTRWRNKTCDQSDWSGGQDPTSSNCASNKYGSQDGNIDTDTPGEIKLR